MSFTALVAHSIFPTAFTPRCSHIANTLSSRFATTSREYVEHDYRERNHQGLDNQLRHRPRHHRSARTPMFDGRSAFLHTPLTSSRRSSISTARITSASLYTSDAPLSSSQHHAPQAAKWHCQVEAGGRF